VETNVLKQTEAQSNTNSSKWFIRREEDLESLKTRERSPATLQTILTALEDAPSEALPEFAKGMTQC